MRTAINNHSTRSLVEKHTTQATKILLGILMPMESTRMLFIIMMLQCPCMQARRDSPPRSPNATGSVAVQDSHRPVRPSTGSTAGGPTDADVDAHQETCSRECDTNKSSSNHRQTRGQLGHSLQSGMLGRRFVSAAQLSLIKDVADVSCFPPSFFTDSSCHLSFFLHRPFVSTLLCH